MTHWRHGVRVTRSITCLTSLSRSPGRHVTPHLFLFLASVTTRSDPSQSGERSTEHDDASLCILVGVPVHTFVRSDLRTSNHSRLRTPQDPAPFRTLDPSGPWSHPMSILDTPRYATKQSCRVCCVLPVFFCVRIGQSATIQVAVTLATHSGGFDWIWNRTEQAQDELVGPDCTTHQWNAADCILSQLPPSLLPSHLSLLPFSPFLPCSSPFLIPSFVYTSRSSLAASLPPNPPTNPPHHPQNKKTNKQRK